MKKFIYLMAMVCTLGFFTACSSDDDNDEKEFVRNEKIEGTWKVQEAGFDANDNSTGSVVLKWEGSDDATITIPGFIDAPYPVKDAIKMAPMLLNTQLRSVLQDVTFNEKGQISATYKEESDDNWKLANDYASYQVVNENMITLFLNTTKITEDIDDAQEKAMITNMLDQFKTGIPVHVSYPATNKVYFYVDKDFVAPIIAMLYAQVMDKEDLARFMILKSVVNQLPAIMEKTTKFEAGIELIK